MADQTNETGKGQTQAMKIVLQRVSQAEVEVDGQVIGRIGAGFLALLGVTGTDTEATAQALADKIARLRVFPDQEGKTNLSAGDVDCEMLVVSQFTLYADTRKGNRPSFTDAASPELANKLYEYFVSCCQGKFKKVATGLFGASMQVRLVNDGPFTIILEV